MPEKKETNFQTYALVECLRILLKGGFQCVGPAVQEASHDHFCHVEPNHKAKRLNFHSNAIVNVREEMTIPPVSSREWTTRLAGDDDTQTLEFLIGSERWYRFGGLQCKTGSTITVGHGSVLIDTVP